MFSNNSNVKANDLSAHVLRENFEQDGCIHREGRDRQRCSEDKSSGKEVEGAKKFLVASPPCDAAAADTFSDTTQPIVKRPPPPYDGRRGEDGRDTNHASYCGSQQNDALDRGSLPSSGNSSSIGNRDQGGGSRCLLEEGKRGSASTPGSGDGVETHGVPDGGDSKEKSLRLRVAGDFVGSVFKECSSAVAWPTTRPVK